MQKSRRLSLSSVFLFAVLVLISGVWVKRQPIEDWFRLRNYIPSAQVSALAYETTMTDAGKHLFYVYHPEINDKQAFNQNCRGGEQTIVLGCYVTKQGIYVYNIDDPRLAGIMQVTSAHEMLHVAYERLSTSQRKKIDAMTAAAYANNTNERLKKVVEQYRLKDPSVVPNELHSILATEVRDLPADLETYYRQYFNDRSVVIAFSEKYEQAFSARKAKVAEYDTRLTSLRKQIDGLQGSLTNLLQTLNVERNRLDELNSTQDFEAYNAAVPSFNAKVRQYNNNVATTQRLIDQFNIVVGERNAIALEENELAKAIDSRPTTVQDH